MVRWKTAAAHRPLGISQEYWQRAPRRAARHLVLHGGVSSRACAAQDVDRGERRISLTSPKAIPPPPSAQANGPVQRAPLPFRARNPPLPKLPKRTPQERPTPRCRVVHVGAHACVRQRTPAETAAQSVWQRRVRHGAWSAGLRFQRDPPCGARDPPARLTLASTGDGELTTRVTLFRWRRRASPARSSCPQPRSSCRSPRSGQRDCGLSGTG